MGVITDIMKSLPLTAVQAEKIADFEAQLEVLKTEKKDLQSKFDAVCLEYERLKKEYEEEVYFSRGIEFRRGRRTGGAWLPFCPQCHLPVEEDHDRENLPVGCSVCDWYVQLPIRQLSPVIAILPK